MSTDCIPDQLSFGRIGRREIVAGFTGGDLSSDAGALLLRQVERRTGILHAFANCFRDHRDQRRVEHKKEELVAQRVIGLVLGYEDLNDHDQLRYDPLLAVAVGKRDPQGVERRVSDQGRALASSATLNRLELLAKNPAADRYKRIALDSAAVDRLLVARFVDSQEETPSEVVLDLDNSDIELHGRQEGRFFHGYYREYCYLPLYVFCGDHLLGVRLQTSDGDPARHAQVEIERIVAQLRAAWPEIRVVIRGDSGFCRDEIMAWCESNDVDYVLGLARNSRLETKIEPELERALRKHERSGQPERVFKQFNYRTRNSWSRSRRVVAKAEQLTGKANPRFVVTSLARKEVKPRALYEDLYCPRGEMENRIKEKQLYLFGARASASSFQGNQARLYFSAIAYLLIQALRDLGLKGTSEERAQAHTIRVKLLKIAARVRFTARKVWVELASNCPFADLFRSAYNALRPRSQSVM